MQRILLVIMQQTHHSDPYPSLVHNALVIDPTQVNPGIAPIQVVTSRDRYQCCHIHFGDSTSGQFYPAICFEDCLYSLCLTRSGEEEAFNAAMQLTGRGRSIVITKIPKGYALWVLEPEAIPSSPKTSSPRRASTHWAEVAENAPATSPAPSPALPTYRVLTANDRHQLCRIHLPQMKKPCLCICLEHHYYKLFQTVETPRQAAKLIKLLTHYNEQSVMTKMPEGYGIWRRIDQQLLDALRGYEGQEDRQKDGQEDGQEDI